MNIRIWGVVHNKPFGFKDPGEVRRILEQLFNKKLMNSPSPHSWGDAELIVYAVTDTETKDLDVKGPDKSKKYIEFGVWLPNRAIVKFDQYDFGYGIYLVKGIVEILYTEKIIENKSDLEKKIIDEFTYVVNSGT